MCLYTNILEILEMDLTCPELVNLSTSDYGSRETSNNTEEVAIEGFCCMFTTIGGKGEICCQLKAVYVKAWVESKITAMHELIEPPPTPPPTPPH